MTTRESATETKTQPVPLNRAVVLVGLMGAGKTSIGRLLGVRLGVEFVDADAEIEAAAGATIEEIFAEDGEAVFRSGERRVIARLLGEPVRVIATGGGAFMDPETRARIKETAVSVWLRADLDTLVKRTQRRGGRPLLKKGDRRKVLAELIAQRYPVYATADITVDTGDEAPDRVVDRVIAALEDHLGVAPLSTSPKVAANDPRKANPRRRGGSGHRGPRRHGGNKAQAPK